MSEQSPDINDKPASGSGPADEIGEESFRPAIPEFSPGKIIDAKYEVLDRIGAGGMAVVYKCRHIHLSRIVAIKVLRSHLIDSQEFLRRFRKEAQVTSRLNHPNAVTVFDSGEADGMPYLVMEFVSGRSLKKKIEEDGPRSVSDLLDVLDDICPALAQAHALGIVHRDIKPDNVILTANDTGGVSARIVDFGIAKTLFQSADDLHTTATVSGMFLGTPKYAAPEQVLGKNVDARTDIYSLGILLYESLVGVVPFDAPTAVELVVKHAQEKPAPFREKRPDLRTAVSVEGVILRCLEKDPGKRFQTVIELQEAFEKAAKRDRFGKLLSKPVLLPAAGLALCLLLAGGWAMFSNRSTPPTPTPEKKITEKPVVALAEKTNPVVNQPIAADKLPPVDLSKLVASVGNAVATATRLTPEEPPIEPPSTEVINRPTEVAAIPPIPENAGLLPLFNTPQLNQPTPVPTQQVAALDTTPQAPPLDGTLPPDGTTITGPIPEPEGPADEVLKSAAEKNFNAGRKLYHQRNYSGAIPLLESAVRGKPRHIKARLDLANCYLRSSRKAEALMQIQAALRIDPNYPPANFDLACYYSLEGNDDAALNALERAIRYEKAAKGWAKSEKDLARLQTNPRFAEIVGN